MSTPEQILKSHSKRTLPFSVACQLTLLVGTKGKIFSGGNGETPSGYTHRIEVKHLDTHETFMLPFLRPSIQLSMHNCKSYEEIAERLNRVGHGLPATASWIKKQIQLKGLPLYFATRWSRQGFEDDSEDEWLAFKSLWQASCENPHDPREKTLAWKRNFNNHLRTKKSRYRIIVEEIKQLREA